jgi:hypothetical protein
MQFKPWTSGLWHDVVVLEEPAASITAVLLHLLYQLAQEEISQVWQIIRKRACQIKSVQCYRHTNLLSPASKHHLIMMH